MRLKQPHLHVPQNAWVYLEAVGGPNITGMSIAMASNASVRVRIQSLETILAT